MSSSSTTEEEVTTIAILPAVRIEEEAWPEVPTVSRPVRRRSKLPEIKWTIKKNVLFERGKRVKTLIINEIKDYE
jgi:hypothetical protein